MAAISRLFQSSVRIFANSIRVLRWTGRRKIANCSMFQTCSEKWQMLFNFGKCKCIHTGKFNEDAQYSMGGTVLNTTLKETYLGLTIIAEMKVP